MILSTAVQIVMLTASQWHGLRGSLVEWIVGVLSDLITVGGLIEQLPLMWLWRILDQPGNLSLVGANLVISRILRQMLLSCHRWIRMLDSSCSIVLGSLGLPVKCETSSFFVAPILTCITTVRTIVLVLGAGLQEEPLRLSRLLLLLNLTMVSLIDFCDV